MIKKYSYILFIPMISVLSLSFLLIPGASGKTTSNYHTLVIGSNDYQALSKLRSTLNDEKVVAKVLHDKNGFNTIL